MRLSIMHSHWRRWMRTWLILLLLLCCKMFRILTMSFRHVRSIYSKMTLTFPFQEDSEIVLYLNWICSSCFHKHPLLWSTALRISIVSSLYLVTIRSTFSNQFTYLRRKVSRKDYVRSLEMLSDFFILKIKYFWYFWKFYFYFHVH